MRAAKSNSVRGSRYSPHPMADRRRVVLENLSKTSGKLLSEWVEIVRAWGEATTKERVRRLKEEHAIGNEQAAWVVEHFEGRDQEESPEALIAAMYAGPKAGLLPIHEALLDLGLSLGSDVRACACATIAPLYRNRVFAQIKPTTRARIDFGFCLRGVEPTSRLIATGGEAKGDRITHRVGITRLDEIDEQVKSWLTEAYDRDA